jgi:hypothetical protein
MGDVGGADKRKQRAARGGAIRRLRHLLDGRIEEIRRSGALRIFGAALGCTHVLTFVLWIRGGFFARVTSESSPVCWPFLPDCDAIRFATPLHAQIALWGYLALSILAVLGFTRRRWIGRGYVALVAVNAMKGALFVADYRLMGNYHYMPFLVSVVYLAWPRPGRTLPYLMVAFYLSAGALKINREWLSGAALISKTWVSGRLLEIACAYVVLLELVIVLGLLSRSRWVRWATLAQLAVFHAYSWHVVGFFYPLVMACLLSFFPLAWCEGAEVESERESGLTRFCSGRAGLAAYAAVSVYAAAQVVPHLFPGDSAITGEGRIFALNMMDARVSCDTLETVHAGSVIRETSDLHPDVGVRVQCDPIRYWNRARNLCLEGEVDGDIRVETYLVSKRQTDESYLRVFGITDFCGSPPDLALLAHNDWIGTR